MVPICPGPLAGDGYLLDEWQSKQALKSFGLPLPPGGGGAPRGGPRVFSPPTSRPARRAPWLQSTS
ncbi:hypothetical protein EGJ92_17310 [Pseudomonas aeruginosa]|nr:hypothetical protein EGJ92_17310 [Pseudomonas aeruginosa]